MKRFVPVAVGICVLLGSLAGEQGLPGLLKAREQTRDLAAQVAALKAQNAALRVRADELKNDPSAIERLARQDFGLARADELVITIKSAAPTVEP